MVSGVVKKSSEHLQAPRLPLGDQLISNRCVDFQYVRIATSEKRANERCDQQCQFVEAFVVISVLSL